VNTNSSEFQLLGNGTTAVSQAVGTLNANGYAFVTFGSTAPNVNGGTLSFTGINRVNKGTLLFRTQLAQANYGTGAASTTVANVLSPNLATQLVGGTGTPGTGSTQVPILPFAIGQAG